MEPARLALAELPPLLASLSLEEMPLVVPQHVPPGLPPPPPGLDSLFHHLPSEFLLISSEHQLAST